MPDDDVAERAGSDMTVERPVLSPAHYQDAQRAETKLASTVGIKPARHQH
jgi:hypothetical protein